MEGADCESAGCHYAEQRSSHGSASLGSGANALGAAMNSPNISHNSAPTCMAGSLPSYHASLETNSLADLLGDPKLDSGGPTYDRSTSGREPGKPNCLRAPWRLQP